MLQCGMPRVPFWGLLFKGCLRMRLTVIFLAFLTVLSGCSSVPSQVVSVGERYAAPAAGMEEYRLGSGDKLKVTVYNEPTLSGEFSVSTSGVVSLPLVGDLNVAGKSANTVALEVQTALSQGYLRDPKCLPKCRPIARSSSSARSRRPASSPSPAG